jgi:hypothetical protein
LFTYTNCTLLLNNPTMKTTRPQSFKDIYYHCILYIRSHKIWKFPWKWKHWAALGKPLTQSRLKRKPWHSWDSCRDLDQRKEVRQWNCITRCADVTTVDWERMARMEHRRQYPRKYKWTSYQTVGIGVPVIHPFDNYVTTTLFST